MSGEGGAGHVEDNVQRARHGRAYGPRDVVLEETKARIPFKVPHVLAPAGIEVVEPENLDAVAAKTIAEVGP